MKPAKAYPQHRDPELGFTLIEVVIAVLIMAGAITAVSMAWSGNTMRIEKARLNNEFAHLLQRKMSEIEIKYQNVSADEIPEEDEGDFPDNPDFHWKLKSKKMEFPDLSSTLTSKEGGANEMTLMVIKQMTEIISKVVTEVLITVSYEKKGRKPVVNTVSTYFVDYKQDFSLMPGAPVPAAGDKSETNPSGPGNSGSGTGGTGGGR